MPLLKTELHAHSAADPLDYIPHSTTELLDRAIELEYQVLAITLHDRYLDVRDLSEGAKRRGLVLIGGIERTIAGAHVLLLNFGEAAGRVQSFDDLEDLRLANPAGVVIAPHPYYPAGSSLGRLLDRHARLFDAVELNAFYTTWMTRFNARAVAFAKSHNKTIVANGDIHRLWQLGRSYSLVESAPHPDGVCAAIRAGDVEIRSTALSTRMAVRLAFDLTMTQALRKPLG